MWVNTRVQSLDSAVLMQHAKALLGLLPILDHEMIAKRFNVVDALANNVRNDLGPDARAVERRRHHPKIDSVKVGEHNEAVAPMINAVFNRLFAGAYRYEAVKGIIC